TDVLARWVNELYPDRRRIFTSKANPVAPFEPEVKRQAVMALCTRQVSASEIARRIGVSRAVLYKWKDEIIGNSAYQRTFPRGRTRCVAGGSCPTESGNTP
ncbi:transposase, partial [Pseudomonas aeruginosa]|uniref:transposase n=1 Tax=Pseudomonas aeruginosa TaxID=287 RepID=UPI0031F64628